MLFRHQITILGAGIAGLACATALARRGAQVRVIEQASAMQQQVGAGLQISPNGAAVLRALGVERDLAVRSPRAERVRLRDFRCGADVFRMPLSRPGHPCYLVHRADLIALLADAARAAGARLEPGRTVKGVALGAGRATLRFSDGAEQVATLVAADGLRSATRAALNPGTRPFFTGQAAWRYIMPLQAPAPPAEVEVFVGPGRHLVRYPLRNGAWMNGVAVIEREGWTAEGWHHRDDPDHLRHAFRDFAPDVQQMLAQVDKVFLWGLFRHPVAQSWHDATAVLVGDAAHPTLPFLAQGANMALEDAWVLADCLAAAADQRAGFARYQALRRNRCARIVRAAGRNAWFYHLRPGPCRYAAHGALRLAGRFAPRVVAGRFEWLYGHDVTRGAA
ncbi:MAG: FAD-dependent monooxygenase [Rhodobacteraceae bacterium]|nr:FAD-dependent monooxygenase [Paracoccaceae bacterium]